jgi:hypothetical protein
VAPRFSAQVAPFPSRDISARPAPYDRRIRQATRPNGTYISLGRCPEVREAAYSGSPTGHCQGLLSRGSPGVDPPVGAAECGNDIGNVRPGGPAAFLVFLALAAPNLLLIVAFGYRPLLSNISYSALDWTLGARGSAKLVDLE